MPSENPISAANSPEAPRPALSTFDAVMIITGIVIGSGIFAFPQLIAGVTGSVFWMTLAWLMGGALSLVGALCYAELASRFPHAGGDYHFLTLAYGKDLSFFFGWARATVITTGSMALGGYVFGDYLTQSFYDLGPHSSSWYAAGVIVVLTLVNLAGLRESARTQNLMTLLLVGGMALVTLAAFFAPAVPAVTQPNAPAPIALGSLGTALIFVLYTYGGWNEAAYISAEVKGGKRAILRVLVLSLLLITVVYLGFVAALTAGLGFAGLQASSVPATDLMRAAFGDHASKLIGVIACLASLTTINATLIVGARSNFALGQDWPVIAFMSRWDGKRAAPVRALWVQASIALVLVGLAALEKNGVAAMVEFTAPVFWLFFLLTGVALFILRRKASNTPRPFSVPLYPVLPLVFCLSCAYLLFRSVAYAQSNHSVQIAFYVMGAGFIAWLGARFKRVGA